MGFDACGTGPPQRTPALAAWVIDFRSMRAKAQGVGFFSSRKRGYRAAIRAEQNRSAAEHLRRDNPELYEQILAQSYGSEAEGAARTNPDVYVALFLAETQDAQLGTSDGLIPEGMAPADSDDPKRDRIFDGLIRQLGGMEEAVATVVQHARMSGRTMDEDDAVRILDEWRLRGIVRNISLGDYLNIEAERGQ
jgi:hypothetical protein